MGVPRGRRCFARLILSAAKPLFAWECPEDSPSLKTIEDLLASLPDARLLDGPRQARSPRPRRPSAPADRD